MQTKVMVPSSQTLMEEDLAVHNCQVIGRMDLFTVTIHKKMRDQEWRVWNKESVSVEGCG